MQNSQHSRAIEKLIILSIKISFIANATSVLISFSLNAISLFHSNLLAAFSTLPHSSLLPRCHRFVFALHSFITVWAGVPFQSFQPSWLAASEWWTKLQCRRQITEWTNHFNPILDGKRALDGTYAPTCACIRDARISQLNAWNRTSTSESPICKCRQFSELGNEKWFVRFAFPFGTANTSNCLAVNSFPFDLCIAASSTMTEREREKCVHKLNE